MRIMEQIMRARTHTHTKRCKVEHHKLNAADSRPYIPYEHLHFGFQKLQKAQVEMKVTEPSVPPGRVGPQAKENNMLSKKNAYKAKQTHAPKWIASFQNRKRLGH